MEIVYGGLHRRPSVTPNNNKVKLFHDRQSILTLVIVTIDTFTCNPVISGSGPGKAI